MLTFVEVTIVIAVRVVVVASGRVQEARPLSGVVGDYTLNNFSIPHASRRSNSDRFDDIAARACVADADGDRIDQSNLAFGLVSSTFSSSMDA